MSGAAAAEIADTSAAVGRDYIVRTKLLAAMAVGLALSACAGRDPQPIASVQAQDQFADCTMIRA
jgi:hypothetical protein